MNKHEINLHCQTAKPYYYDYACGQPDQVPDDISVHIADCSDCLHEIQWLQQMDTEADELSVQTLQTISHAAQLELHCALFDQPVRCSDIKAFLPVLAIPEAAVQITTPVTAHIQVCEQCSRDLETLKELNLSPEQLSCLSQIFSQNQIERSHDVKNVIDDFFRDSTPLQTTIRTIIDQPDSGVVTCFRPKDKTAPADEPPYHIAVVNDLSAPSADSQSRPVKTRTAASRFKWWFKPAAAVAAVAMIALFLFRDSSVDATDIGQIYEALKSVKNVIMTQYDVDDSEPVQQISISRSRGIKLLKTGRDYVLFDIKNKIKKSMDSGEPLQQSRLDHDTIKSVAETMNIPYGLLPFKSASALPKGAVWKKVESSGDIFNPGQAEIYDLFWSERIIGSASGVHYRWRCHLDPVTKHPFKLELWKQGLHDSDYKLVTITEVTYPTEAQMEQTINETGL